MAGKGPEYGLFVPPESIRPVVGRYWALVAYRNDGSDNLPCLSLKDTTEAIKDNTFVRALRVECESYHRKSESNLSPLQWISSIIEDLYDALAQGEQNPLNSTTLTMLQAVETDYKTRHPDEIANTMLNKRRETDFKQLILYFFP